MDMLKKQMIVAGLKAGLEHLAMSHSEEYNTAPGKPEKDTWLCYAISCGKRAGTCSGLEAAAARDHIMKMLAGGDHTTAREYLQEGLKIPEKLLTVKNVQLFRKRWAEHMIEEFS